jgi:hypothetical protein
MSDDERLEWLETNQPRNVVAINAIRHRLRKPLLKDPPKKAEKNWRKIVAEHDGGGKRLRISPCRHWQNRGTSSN